MKQYFVYILTSCKNGTLYTGMTNDLYQRVKYHKNKINHKSFTARYNVNKLVYYEVFETAYDAISREKQIKGGSRQSKLDLINNFNSEWRDLSKDLWD